MGLWCLVCLWFDTVNSYMTSLYWHTWMRAICFTLDFTVYLPGTMMCQRENRVTHVCACVCLSQQSDKNSTIKGQEHSHKGLRRLLQTNWTGRLKKILPFTCSRSAMASHACIRTQPPDHWMHTSISKPHPQAFPSYKAPVMGMNTASALSEHVASYFSTLCGEKPATNI